MPSGSAKGVGLASMPLPTSPPQSPTATTVSNNDDHTASTQNESQSSTWSSLPSGTLEGTLLYRRGQQPLVFKTKMLKQNMRMYTTFDMSDRVGLDFGSLKCYRFVDLTKKEAREAYSSTRLGRGDHGADSDLGKKKQLCLEFPASLPWTVRDVENDTTAFIVEVPTSSYMLGDDWDGLGRSQMDDDAATVTTIGTDSGRSYVRDQAADQFDADVVTSGEGDDNGEDDENDDCEDDEDGVFNFWGDDVQDENEGSTKERESEKPNQVRLDLARAASRNESFVRYAFRCPHKKNEKALWLTAFGKVGRLSTESNRKKGFFSTASAALSGANLQRNSRIRTSAAADRARTSFAMERDIDRIGDNEKLDTTTPASLSRKHEVMEYRVRPSYAYPHRWMTHSEVTEEMTAPSAMVHDLRLNPGVATRRELGLLRVEVLQCLGLPGPKGNTTKPNTAVYLVCGSYAFSTDVIPSCNNPMWLSGTKRACVVPIYHGYARLFAGVFHDDGSKGSSKDTFIGRVAIELARLKPGLTYDITLPLRGSTSVYSRRKLGSIRVRLTLDHFDKKGIVLSYLPNKRNRLAGQVATTVACADPKSFRAVALTVHGKHLPGKFSMESLMATIREFTFVQKSVMRLVQKFVQDLVVWRYPAMSSFAFFGWMHCVHASSATLAPVYMLGMVVLQLVRNYARCIVGGKGFQPTTFEEILFALKDGTADDGTKIRPIEGEKGMRDDANGGVSLFQTLGMLKNDEYFVDGVDTYTHKEFPFSSLAGYPRFSVDEAMKHAPPGKSDLDADSEKDEEIIADMIGDTDDTSTPNQTKLSRHLSGSNEAAYVPKLYFQTPLPEQNIDKKKQNPKSDKTLVEELQEVEEKAHKFTLQLFDDNHAYMITDTTTPPWGRRQQRNEKNGEEYDVKRDLDKLLGLGQFSQWNPIVSKFTVQIEPIVGVFEVALCAYRSVYNIYYWRDPFLSFWFSICCIMTIAVLLLFPWRTVFFAVGVVALGPQNWLMRLFRELVPSGIQVRTGRFLRAFRELLKSDKGDKDDEKHMRRRNVADDSCIPQPIFHYHAPANKANVERNQTIGAQHVRIPYTPLYYHRFYDWPPDPKYARVINGMPFDPSSLYASTQDETVTVRELPTPPQRINQACSIKKDSGEAKDASGVIQVPASKVKEKNPVPAVSSPSTDSLTSTDVVNLALSQPQTSEAVSSTSITGNNTAAGKVWSRALNNLNETITKIGQVKETLETKPTQRKEVSFDKDGLKGEEIIQSGTRKLSAGAMIMGRRITNMSAKLPSNSTKSKRGAEESTPNIAASDWSVNWLTAGVGNKGDTDSSLQNTTAHKDDQNDTEDEVGAPGPTDEKIGTLLVQNNAGGQVHDKEGVRPEGSSLPTKYNNEVIGEHALVPLTALDEEAITTKVSEDEAREKPADTPGSTLPPSAITKKDDCKSDPKLSVDTGYSEEEEIKHGELGEAIENGEDSSDVIIPSGLHNDFERAVALLLPVDPKGTCREQEGGKDTDSDVNIEAVGAAENTTSALLLEELMAVKLELATARTENDHYRRVLKETEEELDTSRNKCIQYEKHSFKLMSPFNKKK